MKTRHRIFNFLGVFLGITISLFLVWYFILTDMGRDKREGLVYDAVNKIEEYKIQNGKLPESFKDVGLYYDESGPIYYDLEKGGTEYSISFGSYGVGHSVVYYPATKTWGEVF